MSPLLFLASLHRLFVRAEAPFKTLADLKRINMYDKEIWTLGRRNMLECLDVCRPSKPADSSDDVVVDSSSSATSNSPGCTRSP